MTSAKSISFAREDALPYANAITKLLQPFCERLEVLGSIRRQRLSVHDIELLAIPKFGPVPGKLLDEEDQLEAAVTRLLGENRIGNRTKNGDRFKQFEFRYVSSVRPIVVDLFICRPPQQWGMLKMIRTGPADFSRMMVSRTTSGGILQAGWYYNDGAYSHNGERVETPTEESVFKALSIDFIPPHQRTEQRLIEVAAERV